MPHESDTPPDPHRHGSDVLESALFEIKRVIAGQDAMLERVLVCLLADGHLLLEGVPGLAKTLHDQDARRRCSAATSAACSSRPTCCPPISSARASTARAPGTFDAELGPVLSQLPARRRDQPRAREGAVGAARGDAGAAGHDRRRDVSRCRAPFLVMATQNPIEQEGTYPLPEAQVDRFMLKVVVGYPSADEELTIAERSLAIAPELARVLEIDQLADLQLATAAVYVDRRSPVRRHARPQRHARPAAARPAGLGALRRLGASPRGPISMLHAARALALLRGRSYVLPQDVRELAPDALRHRLVMSYQALAEDVTADQVIEPVIDSVLVPRLDLARQAVA